MAGFVINPFTGILDADSSTIVASADPASASNGTWLINTTTGLLKIYYASAWHTIFTFPSIADNLLLQTGDSLLLNDGSDLLLSEGPVVLIDNLLLQTGDDLLLEQGGQLELSETAVVGTDFSFVDSTTFSFVDSTTFSFVS